MGFCVWEVGVVILQGNVGEGRRKSDEEELKRLLDGWALLPESIKERAPETETARQA